MYQPPHCLEVGDLCIFIHIVKSKLPSPGDGGAVLFESRLGGIVASAKISSNLH